MTNLQRRLKKLEAQLNDPSGLVPHSHQWLEYWDRRLYDFEMDPDRRWPAALFPLEAWRAVMKYSENPASLFGAIDRAQRQTDEPAANPPRK